MASQVLKLFDVEWDYTGLAEQLTAIVGTIFAILALLGVVNDPTTEGVGDSRQALTYETPNSFNTCDANRSTAGTAVSQKVLFFSLTFQLIIYVFPS